MGNIKSFRDLEIWRRSKRMAIEIYKVTDGFPDSEKFGLCSQLRRAAVSIPSNIAEGWGRNTPRYFTHFLRNAAGSLYEIETQIEISNELGYIKDETKILLLNESTTIGKMIFRLIDKINIPNEVNDSQQDYSKQSPITDHYSPITDHQSLITTLTEGKN
jgi:four helix bundle protein